MTRKIIINSRNGLVARLVETAADNEEQLQELLKANPDLLPLEDLGLTGPAIVIGR